MTSANARHTGRAWPAAPPTKITVKSAPMSSAVKLREVPARLLRECVPVLASVKAALRAACGRP
jgi:hypothetical protein